MTPTLEIQVTDTTIEFKGAGFTPREQYSFHAELNDDTGTPFTEIGGGNNKTDANGGFDFTITRWDDGKLASVHARAWHDDASAEWTA